MVNKIMHEDNKLIIYITLENNVLKLNIKDEDLKFIDGYALVCLELEHKYFIRGVINQAYEAVIPFSFSKKNTNSITLFKNKKVIYESISKNKTKKFYLIDIPNTLFSTSKDNKVPINPVMEFDGYDVLNSEKAIVLIKDKLSVLDVKSGQLSKMKFDKIVYKKDQNGKIKRIGVIFIPCSLGILGEDVYLNSEDFVYIMVNCHLSSYGQIINPVYVDGAEIWFSNDVLEDYEKLCDAVFKTFYDKNKDVVKCKIIQ